MASMNIDVNAGETITTDFDPLPTDWYRAQVIESKLVQKDNGIQLDLTWEVLEGPFAKRRVWQREWAQHSSPSAQDIGQRMIRTLGKAMGMSVVDDDEKLRFKPVEIRVGLEKKEEGRAQRNEVKSARPINGMSAPVGGAAQTQGQNQSTVGAATGSASRPWNNAAA